MKVSSLIAALPATSSPDARGSSTNGGDGHASAFGGLLTDLGQEPPGSRSAKAGAGDAALASAATRVGASDSFAFSRSATKDSAIPATNRALAGAATKIGADVLNLMTKASADGEDTDEKAPAPKRAWIAEEPSGNAPSSMNSMPFMMPGVPAAVGINPTWLSRPVSDDAAAHKPADSIDGMADAPDHPAGRDGSHLQGQGDAIIVTTPQFEAHLAFATPGSVSSGQPAVMVSGPAEAIGLSVAKGTNSAPILATEETALAAAAPAAITGQPASGTGSRPTPAKTGAAAPLASSSQQERRDRLEADDIAEPATQLAAMSAPIEASGNRRDPLETAPAASIAIGDGPSASPSVSDGSPLAAASGVVTTVPQLLTKVAATIVEMAAPPASAVPRSGEATPISPARTMTLQLNAGELGTLSIRLHVAGHALDVHLAASDPRTAAMLGREKDVLSAALHDQNYKLQTLDVTSNDAPLPAPGGTHAEPRGGDRSNLADNADRGDPRSGRGGGSGHDPGARKGGAPLAKDDASSLRGDARALFV